MVVIIGIVLNVLRVAAFCLIFYSAHPALRQLFQVDNVPCL
jgi:hypothetical protein